MRTSTARRPRWYVAIRSPYSWLALHDAVREDAALLTDSDLRVFFEPGPPLKAQLSERSGVFHYTPMSRAKHLYIVRDVSRLARKRGLVVSWPVDTQPRWEVSAFALARVLRDSQDDGKRLAMELSTARWTRGRDVHDEATVVECLSELGLNPEFASLHRTDEGQDIGRALLTQLDRDQVFGVPFVVVAGEPYWGLDRLPAADRTHREGRIHPMAPLAAHGDSTEPVDDQPGGCG